MSEMINIQFPDGNEKEFEKGITGEEIAHSISPGLRKQALAIKLNGEPFDLRRPIEQDGAIEIITYKNPEGLEVLRHSTAHLMAQAIKRLYGEVNLGVGPVIENGFYYDIDLDVSLTPEDLPKIEKEMQRIVDENLEVERIELSRQEAIEKYKELGDELKLELIEDIPEGEPLTIYKQGEFFDLCRGGMYLRRAKLKSLNC